ncbi:hypothetical protein [uncultured Marinococcus sp.]|uniref:DUF6414 family protein n=1 Tax=uncultured Marinococcus sp. TaxID=487012 RepID=UPI00262D69DD|nr:hypothetical protein [uncultured Marinococcus sp.]
MELLGFPISGEANYNRTTTSNLQNTKSLHDYAFEQMRLGLEENNLMNDVTNSKHFSSETSNKNFVKISGGIEIFDYETLAQNLSNFGQLDRIINNKSKDETSDFDYGSFESMMDLFNGNQSQPDEFEQFSNLVSTLYSNLTTIEMTNSKNLTFSGTINKEYLRETIRNIIYKYGSNLEGKWEMVCQITKIPTKESTSVTEKMNDFGKNIKNPDLEAEKTLADFMNRIVSEFNQIQEAFASVNFPKIAVDPIAIYKEHE